jgi:hypothetical protein
MCLITEQRFITVEGADGSAVQVDAVDVLLFGKSRKCTVSVWDCVWAVFANLGVLSSANIAVSTADCRP